MSLFFIIVPDFFSCFSLFLCMVHYCFFICFQCFALFFRCFFNIVSSGFECFSLFLIVFDSFPSFVTRLHCFAECLKCGWNLGNNKSV